MTTLEEVTKEDVAKSEQELASIIKFYHPTNDPGEINYSTRITRSIIKYRADFIDDEVVKFDKDNMNYWFYELNKYIKKRIIKDYGI
ncbi:MAG: hypothetical protein IH948_00245 [Bacteroidetes bacterium]|nr:hypothetical protein [Bacteroidota bacterium]